MKREYREKSGPILIVWLSCFLALGLVGLIAIELESPYGSIVGEWIGYVLPLLLIFGFLRGEKRKFWSAVGVKKRGLGLGFVWILALLVVFTFILTAYQEVALRIVGKDPGEEVFNRMRRELPDWYFAYLMVSSFIPVALSEELVFRGFILERLIHRGAIFAILSTSAMHSSVHLWYLNFGIPGLTMFGSAFLFFCWMGIAYTKSRNTVAPVFMHGLNNSFISIRFFFGEGTVRMFSELIFLVGWICLMYLAFRHLSKMAKKKTREKEAKSMRPSDQKMRMEYMLHGLEEMMERLKSFKKEGKISAEEYERLKTDYLERIREIKDRMKA